MKLKGQAIYGSSVHRVILEFQGEPSPSMSGTAIFYERDQVDQEHSFNSFQKLVEIVKKYWEEKTSTEVFNRRLASWFADYFQDLGYGEIDTYKILEWMSSASAESSEKESSSITSTSVPSPSEQQPPLKESEEVIIEEFVEKEINTETVLEEKGEASKDSASFEKEEKKDIVELIKEKASTENNDKSASVITPSSAEKIETSEDMIRAVMEKVSASSKSEKTKKQQPRRASKKPRKRQPRKK